MSCPRSVRSPLIYLRWSFPDRKSYAPAVRVISSRTTGSIDGGPRTATVTATAPIEALVIDRDGFERLMDDFPTLRLDLVSALTQRLRQRSPEPVD